MKWLNSIKVGDLVIIKVANTEMIKKVTRLTKTLIIVDSFRFRKCDGVSPGDSWNFNVLVKATPERITKLKLKNKMYKARNFIKNTNFNKVSLNTLEKIITLIKEDYNEKN